MLSDDKIESIRQAAYDASLGNNTQDLMRRYGRDVTALLADREELMKQLQQAKELNGHLMTQGEGK